MAYSCSDFVDDVLNSLVVPGLIKKDDIPDDNPEGQATLAIQSVIRASAGAASAKPFFALRRSKGMALCRSFSAPSKTLGVASTRKTYDNDPKAG
jgi:hypothetical protein